MGATVLLIELSGEISELRVETILHAASDLDFKSENVRAILLRINSNGGTLGAAQSLAAGLLRLSQETNCPIVTFVGEQALSAAFYVALTSDLLVVTPSALLGSVGAIQHYYSFANLARKFGVDVHTFSAGAHKSASSPLETINQKQITVLQETLDDTA